MIYRNKIKPFFKLYSCIIIPMLILIICLALLKTPLHMQQTLCKDKANLIVNLDGTFIGVLLTIFTIYVSFPLSAGIRKRFTESKHQRIFISHIWTGIILFILSMFMYLIFDQYVFVAVLFFMGMSNLVVTAYYITMLITHIGD